MDRKLVEYKINKYFYKFTSEQNKIKKNFYKNKLNLYKKLQGGFPKNPEPPISNTDVIPGPMTSVTDTDVIPGPMTSVTDTDVIPGPMTSVTDTDVIPGPMTSATDTDVRRRSHGTSSTPSSERSSLSRSHRSEKSSSESGSESSSEPKNCDCIIDKLIYLKNNLEILQTTNDPATIKEIILLFDKKINESINNLHKINNLIIDITNGIKQQPSSNVTEVIKSFINKIPCTEKIICDTKCE